MARDIPPIRSLLFCAGDQDDEINAGLRSGADAIVIDLEEPRTPFPEPDDVPGMCGVGRKP